MMVAILYTILCFIGSQCSLRRVGEMWLERFTEGTTALAREF